MGEEREKREEEEEEEEEEKEEVFRRAEHAWRGGGGMERGLGVLVGSVACAWRCQSAWQWPGRTRGRWLSGCSRSRCHVGA